MPDDGLEYATDENDLHTKANRKMRFIGNGTQITNISTTYGGQLAFCTTNGGSFLQNKIYGRLADNSAWSGNLQETSESSQTSGTPSTTSVPGNATMHGVLFTLPSTEKFYFITGLEWKNSTTINGNVFTGVFLADNPSSTIPILALSQEVAQSGSDAIQRVSIIRSKPIKAGTNVGFFIQSSSATARFYLDDSGGDDYAVGKAYNPNPNSTTGNFSIGGGARFYCKIYYRGYS